VMLVLVELQLGPFGDRGDRGDTERSN
jgi:hypothetical protein